MDVGNGVSYAQLRVAASDELEIEHELIVEAASTEDLSRIVVADLVLALQWIDAWKIDGRYAEKRKALKKLIGDRLPKVQLTEQEERMRKKMKSEWHHFTNFREGLYAHDPAERQDFEAVADAMKRLGIESLHDAWPFIKALRKAKPGKGKGGKPRAMPPWRYIAPYLDQMRLDIARGATIPAAARECAELEGKAQKKSRAEYFERLYRQRQALREINP